ncbi:MAG: SDR family oxidoreductase [Nocardioidaceae bacterium]|nr:SDR family oxidoreductase [Nocardioidaceae bacterium]
MALVTGAARGIGAEVADALARAGHEVVGCDLGEVVSRDGVAMRTCDVSDAGAVQEMVDAIEAENGPVEVLVNNAGILRNKPLRHLTSDEIEAVIRVNLLGTIWCTQAVGTLMTARGYGRVISMASITATKGEAHTSAYAASKGGVIGFTRALAREYAHRGVTVNAVAPGFIATDQTRDVFVGEVGDAVMAQIPARRLGTPADIAAMVVFLAGSASSYVTGQVLTVDGGVT